MKKMDEMTLFEESELSKVSTANQQEPNAIDISFMHFIEKREMTYEDIFFAGFNSIKVMTYSFGLPFISKLIKPFEQAEVIVSPSAIRMDTAEILVAQGTSYLENSANNVLSVKSSLRT